MSFAILAALPSLGEPNTLPGSPPQKRERAAGDAVAGTRRRSLNFTSMGGFPRHGEHRRPGSTSSSRPSPLARAVSEWGKGELGGARHLAEQVRSNLRRISAPPVFSSITCTRKQRAENWSAGLRALARRHLSSPESPFRPGVPPPGVPHGTCPCEFREFRVRESLCQKCRILRSPGPRSGALSLPSLFTPRTVPPCAKS